DQNTLESQDSLSRAIVERYRCPEDLFRFTLSGALSEAEGYFRFGSDVIAYGQTSAGTPKSSAGASLENVLPAVSSRDGVLSLPFNPNTVLENLLYERYLNGGGARSRMRSVLKHLYYYVRPFTTLSGRRMVQRFHA